MLSGESRKCVDVASSSAIYDRIICANVGAFSSSDEDESEDCFVLMVCLDLNLEDIFWFFKRF